MATSGVYSVGWYAVVCFVYLRSDDKQEEFHLAINKPT
jgi:hypothetical protein